MEKNYQATDQNFWEGRVDGASWEEQRWHQVIETVNLPNYPLASLQKEQKGISILGFMSDEGVRRNKGRTGAIDGPYSLRKACMNLPVHFSENTKLVDAGNVICKGEGLEEAQEELGKAVYKILASGYTPMVFGGGHETSYGHYLGIKDYLKQYKTGSKLGIINFDAHFDLRAPEKGVTSSGTPFWQIAQEEGDDFKYLVLGVNKHSNTKKLYQTAESLGVKYVSGRKFNDADRVMTIQKISEFIDSCDAIYLTIDMDVFSGAFAPGVSAPAMNGVTPNPLFIKLFKKILKSEKVIATDIVEINPKYDYDNRTARLAATLAFEIVNTL